MTGLLTLADFHAIRDQLAVASMLERGRDLEVKADEAFTRARALRKKADSIYPPNRQTRELLMHKYDEAMREWATCEAMIGDILNDERYIRHMEQELKAS